MPQVIDLEEGRLQVFIKKGFRNWKSRFNEDFGADTRLTNITFNTLCILSQGRENSNFYIYDLIMNISGMGSGFEFNELEPKEKMAVIDQYLFLLDSIRFECMKRLGWFESCPGDDYTLVELIRRFDSLAPHLKAQIPVLSEKHPQYEQFSGMTSFEKEAFIRKLIPKALDMIKGYSTTL